MIATSEPILTIEGVTRRFGGLIATTFLCAGLTAAGVIDGWTMTIALAIAFVAWPQSAEIVVARRQPRPDSVPLEWAGLEQPLTPEELAEVDRALALERDEVVVA